MEENKESFEECIKRINNKIGRRKIKFSRKLSLEELAEVIKDRVNEGRRVEGIISYKTLSYIKGTGVRINRSYNFFGKFAEETALYDDKSQIEDEAFKDGIEDLTYFVKPYRVTFSGNKVFVEAPKRNTQSTLFR